MGVYKLLNKSPYPDQRVPKHESLYPLDLKSARIEIPHIGYTYLWNWVSTLKLNSLGKIAPNVEDFNSC